MRQKRGLNQSTSSRCDAKTGIPDMGEMPTTSVCQRPEPEIMIASRMFMAVPEESREYVKRLKEY